MGTLYELIQSAHRTAKDHADGKPINFIHLNHPDDYRRNNKKTLEVTAYFCRTSQNLQRISTTLIDRNVDETFNEEEIQSFTRFMGNPFILHFKGSNPEDSFLPIGQEKKRTAPVCGSIDAISACKNRTGSPLSDVRMLYVAILWSSWIFAVCFDVVATS